MSEAVAEIDPITLQMLDDLKKWGCITSCTTEDSGTLIFTLLGQQYTVQPQDVGCMVAALNLGWLAGRATGDLFALARDEATKLKLLWKA